MYCPPPPQVQLGSHPGYLGGLTRAFAQDMTAPYFATSSEEVLFHVSTRMRVPLEQKVLGGGESGWRGGRVGGEERKSGIKCV